MEKYSNPTLGERLQIVRKSINYSQTKLGKDIGYSGSFISRIESRNATCDEQLLKKIRKALGIEEMPLLDEEDAFFRERLHVLREEIRNGRIASAKEMQKSLSAIQHLAFKPDLIRLYKMHEIKVLIRERKYVLAEEKLKQHEPEYDAMDNECLYHYHFNIGSVNMGLGQTKKSLEHYTKAYNINNGNLKKEASLYINIAVCCFRLGSPHNCIDYINEANTLFNEEHSSAMRLRIDNLHGVCLMLTGRLEQSRILLEKSLVRARGLNDTHYIGMIAHNLGCLCIKSYDFEQALNYFNHAFDYLDNDDKIYLENLYYKLRYFVDTKNINMYKKHLFDAEAISTNREGYLILFKSLGHLLSLGDSDSSSYIMDITIPYLMNNYDYFKALDYCELLEAHYEAKRNMRNTLVVKTVICDIYKKMFYGGD